MNSRYRNKVFNGGGALPLSYFNGGFDTQLTNNTGADYNYATAAVARPALPQTAGGCATRKNRKGGFYPSVMGPFVSNAARLAVPLAAVATSHYLSAPPYFKRSAVKKVKHTLKRKSKGRKGSRKH